ncbi:substrate-binding domain-containing protein [Bacillus tianshenii]|uniref:sugar ABC transporter substrate-binding protein n=1 Tax=Sutcliffiella tianshenii TaxID=1463404 RepID=UPI001CD71E2C|nr:substrate-binding domain-containing protein [Bacillus tianshenii]MCA1318504.1 substrate-binding domain-containing protein [Bacillus tianshenii]
MRKTSIIVLCILIAILCNFTFVSAGKVFRSDWKLPPRVAESEEQHRLVLITQDRETPFWDEVASGAMRQAKMEGASLEVWGSYGKNKEEFLKSIEIAIQSKVDGIIIQGLDNEEFKDLTKIKASFYGIPIITVANDVPMNESLRRTYVGSDQYLAGKMIARELLNEMGEEGSVVLMYDSQKEFYQQERLKGIEEVLKHYPNIEMVHAATEDTREQITASTRDVLNRAPDAEAFIAVNANVAGAMIKEIGKRSQVAPFHIYSFDDGPESLSLLRQGKLDGMIEQSPEMMGQVSVQLMMEWLNGVTVPLDKNGYLTEITILKAADVQ